MKRVSGFVASIFVALSNTMAHAVSPTLIVHEWGTFTSFQDANGATISGINVDDEPVPKFVHRLRDMPVFTTRSTPATWSQGAPRCHPDVTLRLETPVLYFYPQSGFSGQPFDVRATFAGGWLTEFYPFAEAANSGFPGELHGSTRGSLQWTQLRLAENPQRVPQTTEHVWTAPRAVHSAVVTEGRRQEAEKYLFYRGVGKLDAPLVIRDDGRRLTFLPRTADLSPYPELWVISVQQDGFLSYAHVPDGKQGAEGIGIPESGSAMPGAAAELRNEIAEALEARGLYKEEALAMLDTWELSYFQSEGVRVMFLLPRSWTDAHLPLAVSAPADITRVMLGRIELVSPYQRAQLRHLMELPDSAFDLAPLYTESPQALRNMQAGNASHADLYRGIGREVPEALQLYDSLGRFRDALLVHEAKSARDETAKARLETILRKFGACTASFSDR